VRSTVDLRTSPRSRAWPPALAPARLDRLTHPTPFLICDGATLERHYQDLTDLLPQVRLFYAMKSNPMPEVVGALTRLGAGVEVASIYELRAATGDGIDPADVLFSNTVKPAAHVAEAYRAGLHRFAFDSEGELHKLAEVAPGAKVYVRLQV
jgi:ornithine decarboxylase